MRRTCLSYPFQITFQIFFHLLFLSQLDEIAACLRLLAFLGKLTVTSNTDSRNCTLIVGDATVTVAANDAMLMLHEGYVQLIEAVRLLYVRFGFI